jgi:choline dehydrogenase
MHTDESKQMVKKAHKLSIVIMKGTRSELFFSLYFLVGAGTAGCVLANRLSEDAESSVLIIEAGGSEAGNINISIPVNHRNTLLSKEDWDFRTEPQKNACLAMQDGVTSSIAYYSYAFYF